MRLREIPGFTVYDIYNRVIFQRSHLEKLSFSLLIDAFEHYRIRYVIGLARAKNVMLQKLEDAGYIQYFHYPIPDGKLSDAVIGYTMRLATELVPYMLNGIGVLSHCNAGRNRSGLMSAILVHKLLYITGKSAMEIVRKERPRAIDNIYFEEFIRSL